MGKSNKAIVSETSSALNLPEIGSYTVPSVASQLYSWMRTFWTKLYRDKAFVKYLQGSRALRYAQLYLDLLENVQLLDHTTAPVFHRERWYPIIVRKDRRNEAPASVARLGKGDIVLSDGLIDGYESQIKLGEYVDRADCVAYSLDDNVVAVLSCIVDNIAEPHVILNDGSDFKIEDNSIVLLKKNDPFDAESGFAVFEIPESPESEATEEAVLWACDTLIDKDYVFKYSGYAVGLQTESSEIYGQLVRRVWDATTDGLNPEHLRQVLAALCGVPCVIESDEKIKTVYSTNEFTQVVTDCNVYTLGVDAVLRDSIKAGNVVHRGDFLDTAVRIYPFVVFTDKLSGYTEFSLDQFKKDVSSLSIPAALIRSDLSSGFYVGWDERDIICDGFDRNGNPKLRFDVGLDEKDDVRYWMDVWSQYEAEGTSIAGCFKGLNSGSIHEGEVCGKVVPIEFFLRNLVGANTLIIFIDTDKIAEDAPLYDPNFFNALRKLIPDQIRLYFIEHGTAVDEEYDENFIDSDSDVAVTESRYYDDDQFEEQDDEVVSLKWQRRCKSKNHGDDEDDDY